MYSSLKDRFEKIECFVECLVSPKYNSEVVACLSYNAHCGKTIPCWFPGVIKKITKKGFSGCSFSLNFVNMNVLKAM